MLRGINSSLQFALADAASARSFFWQPNPRIANVLGGVIPGIFSQCSLGIRSRHRCNSHCQLTQLDPGERVAFSSSSRAPGRYAPGVYRLDAGQHSLWSLSEKGRWSPGRAVFVDSDNGSGRVETVSAGGSISLL